MVINHLSLKSFRNYKDFEIGFHPNINYIYGNNGQGKTNLIESLYFLTHLRSFRTNILKNLNQYSHKDSYIHAGLKKNETDHLIQIGIYQNFKKVLLDNKNIHFTSEFIKDFFSILFSPDLLASFKESPTDRRLFFDRVLLMTEPGYFNKYHEFNKIKKNKNELLKKGKKKELKVWNRLLAEVIPVITRDRKNIVL
ncbi:MAG: AAA family ATPase, partial [Deltaproteobacteria bacterium]|nr:AAA family ATPase [Deltaproteobacteria bacterium]